MDQITIPLRTAICFPVPRASSRRVCDQLTSARVRAVGRKRQQETVAEKYEEGSDGQHVV